MIACSSWKSSDGRLGDQEASAEDEAMERQNRHCVETEYAIEYQAGWVWEDQVVVRGMVKGFRFAHVFPRVQTVYYQKYEGVY